MKSKKIMLAVIFCVCSSLAAFAQNQFPNETDTTNAFWDQYRPATYLALAGEGTLTNYGFAISVPVIWIENRIKMTPILGLFWKDFAADGFDLNPAAGAKFLYYFKRQAFGHNQTNSFYAGLGGMGTVRDLYNTEVTERSRAGLILGYDFNLNNTTGMAPELRLEVNENGNFYPAVGIVMHFGK